MESYNSNEMAKRLTDSNIWKSQKWFRKLSPIHKLVWKYITDLCDHAGVWKIDIGELLDDLNIDQFDLKIFIDACNCDFDKLSGQKIFRERIMPVGREYVWVTGFITFQYGNQAQQIDAKNSIVVSALKILKALNLYELGISKQFISYSIPPLDPGVTPGIPPLDPTKARDKDKDKDKTINVSFDDFWNLYNKKVGEKGKLKKKWEALKPEERLQIMKYIPEYKISKPDKQYRKDPTTFFNNKSWNDEIIYSNNSINGNGNGKAHRNGAQSSTAGGQDPTRINTDGVGYL